jgi:hypothetical protein
MNVELQVPYGLAPDGKLVHAKDAIRQLEYCCPECSSPLVLHAGDVVSKHFAHKANTSCNGETVAHQTAKRLIAQVINERTPSTNSISMVCTCDCCHETFSRPLLSSSFSEARVEQRVGKFVCDVVALRNQDYVLAIEILATHAIEEEKKHGLSVPWVELSANAVLENPYRWVPIKSRLKPVLCPRCKSYLKRLNEVAERWQVPILKFGGYRDPSRANYLAAIESCWKCKNDIIVYWWRGVPFCEIEPPESRPQTIKYRYSKTYGGKYWANTCPGCGSIQGDNFLFLFEKAPFAGLPRRELTRGQAQNTVAVKQFTKIMLRNFDV